MGWLLLWAGVIAVLAVVAYFPRRRRPTPRPGDVLGDGADRTWGLPRAHVLGNGGPALTDPEVRNLESAANKRRVPRAD